MSNLASAIDELATVDVAGLPSSVQVADLEQLMVAERRLQAEIARRLRAAESSDALVAETGYGPRSWLIAECHLGRAEASQRVRAARALGECPAVAAAFAAGTVGHEHVRVLTKTLLEVPAGEQREEAERILLDLAMKADPATVGRAVADVRARLGLDESAEQRWARRYADRYLTADRTFDGYLSGSYLLPPEVGSALIAALDAHIEPAGPEDERTLGQRRADALGELAAQHLTLAGLPDDQGERPRVVLVADYDVAARQVAELYATLDGRWEISPETLRRTLCDAEILPAVMSGPGTVLDLGRTTKAWSVAQRRAVRLRDGAGCVFGACPHRWTHLHHAQWWSRGGRTDLANAVPTCKFHHWLVHDGGWQARRDPDGSYVFTNPAGVERRFRQPRPG